MLFIMPEWQRSSITRTTPFSTKTSENDLFIVVISFDKTAISLVYLQDGCLSCSLRTLGYFSAYAVSISPFISTYPASNGFFSTFRPRLFDTELSLRYYDSKTIPQSVLYSFFSLSSVPVTTNTLCHWSNLSSSYISVTTRHLFVPSIL